ncbi:MFS transporter [Candidatus Woesearchaeota archaeon]|nr:MFS transporter [Candidatus Woesearchaeota archaeon]
MKKEVGSVKVKDETKKSLKYSVISGSFYGVTDGSANSYVSPFAIAMNASNNQVALLTSIPSLIGPLSQLGTVKAMEKTKSRKKIIIMSALLQSMMLIPMMLIPFIFLNKGAAILVVLFSLYAVFGSFFGPAWTSWMGDLVPEKIRGRYFGNRAKIIGLVILVVSLIAGFLLDRFPKNKVFIGFFVLFLVAFIARLLSVYFVSKMYEPKLVIKKSLQFSFFEFIKKVPSNNFGRFSIYIALINFAVYVAGPFFAVYMLKDLEFNYVQYTIINIVSGMATLIGLPLWGKFEDKYGNVRALKICGLLIPLVPLLWTFSPNFYYLVFIQIYAGLVWSGFNLAAANFIFDATSIQRRATCDAYNTILSGIGIFIGAILGGYLATHLKISFMNIFLFIFVISTILRLLISLLILPTIKEVRKVKRTPLLSIIGLTQKGFNHETIGWNAQKKK